MVPWQQHEQALSEHDLDPDPYVQFQNWLQAAIEAGEALPKAMGVATTSADGAPSVRMLLLETFEKHGFVFLTNIEPSR